MPHCLINISIILRLRIKSFVNTQDELLFSSLNAHPLSMSHLNPLARELYRAYRALSLTYWPSRPASQKTSMSSLLRKPRPLRISFMCTSGFGYSVYPSSFSASHASASPNPLIYFARYRGSATLEGKDACTPHPPLHHGGERARPCCLLKTDIRHNGTHGGNSTYIQVCLT